MIAVRFVKHEWNYILAHQEYTPHIAYRNRWAPEDLHQLGMPFGTMHCDACHSLDTNVSV